MNKNCLYVAIIGVSISLTTFKTSLASDSILNERVLETSLINGTSDNGYRESPIGNVVADEEVITIKIVPGEMRFDKTKFSVKAGATVKVVVENPDFMQHNLLILKPGSLDKVGNAADALAGMANGAELQYVPKVPEVLFYTPLLNQGDKFELTVKVPDVLGEYPFVCTFPGHWRMMSGTMTVAK